MKKRKEIRYLIIAALFIATMAFLFIRSNNIETSNEYSGVIEKVTIGDKGTPEVVVNGKTYFITYPGKKFKEKIEAGDSLIKRHNSRFYKLIKRQSGIVIYSNAN